MLSRLYYLVAVTKSDLSNTTLKYADKNKSKNYFTGRDLMTNSQKIFHGLERSRLGRRQGQLTSKYL